MDKKKILVVEDDSDLLDLVSRKLSQIGFEVIGLATGQGAMDYLRAQKPDLMILDILLPDIDGITILNELINFEGTKNIPVIIFSNLDQRGSFEQVSAVGNFEYLIKAKTDLNDLASKVKEKLGLN